MTCLKCFLNKRLLTKHLEQGLEYNKPQQTLAVTALTIAKYIPGSREYGNKWGTVTVSHFRTPSLIYQILCTYYVLGTI